MSHFSSLNPSTSNPVPPRRRTSESVPRSGAILTIYPLHNNNNVISIRSALNFFSKPYPSGSTIWAAKSRTGASLRSRPPRLSRPASTWKSAVAPQPSTLHPKP